MQTQQHPTAAVKAEQLFRDLVDHIRLSLLEAEERLDPYDRRQLEHALRHRYGDEVVDAAIGGES